jgi:hypothetical protein
VVAVVKSCHVVPSHRQKCGCVGAALPAVAPPCTTMPPSGGNGADAWPDRGGGDTAGVRSVQDEPFHSHVSLLSPLAVGTEPPNNTTTCRCAS